jgi:hypothetical protein
MNARIFIATLGIFITLIVLTYGCSADRSYRDEYINLLEEKLSNQSPVPAEATIVEELSDEEVRTQTFDLLSFACGNTPSVYDVRVRKSAKDQWSVIVVIATDSIDPYGFEVYDKVFLSGTANGDIIEFKNVEALIERCE